MIQVEALDPQLQRIAQQVTQKHGNWRVESEDMLQEARIGAWQALQRADVKGLGDAEARRYALGGARKECERAVTCMKKDALWDAESYGLIENLTDQTT